ncbi:hypothetical protein FNV43_RR01209 [Rhamnella rubrinervis]|uniref:Uncharacterized protein n=1 Tax=Rhamnella rubrinervis TaxID=2594499 RepID=A0A8K0HP75_9ROSA|nr:hypothetical protein FNV43_RR01209 [Rhamnella rubrinervis]
MLFKRGGLYNTIGDLLVLRFRGYGAMSGLLSYSRSLVFSAIGWLKVILMVSHILKEGNRFWMLFQSFLSLPGAMMVELSGRLLFNALKES